MEDKNSIHVMSAPVPLGPGFDPHVAVESRADGNIRLHAAWIDAGRIMYTDRTLDAAAAAPVTINSAGRCIGAVDENGYPWSALDLAVAADGTVHLVALGADTLLYCRRQSGAWLAWRELHCNHRGLVFPVVATHRSAVTVAWQERCEPGDRGGAVVTMQSHDRGDSWGEAVQHWAGGKNPRLKYSPAGVLYLLARGPVGDGHNCQLRWHDGQGWSDPERCTDGAGNVGIADLVIEPDGKLLVAWSDSAGRDGPEKAAVFLSRKVSGRWGCKQLLYHDSSAKPHMHLAQDGRGDVYVMNSNTVDRPPRYRILRGDTPAAGGELFPPADASHFFDLKPLPCGVVMVWTRLQNKLHLKEQCTGTVLLATLGPADRRPGAIVGGRKLERAEGGQGDVRPIGLITGMEKGLDPCLEEIRRHGLPVAQFRTPFAAARSRFLAWEIRRRFREAGVRITAVFAGFADEDYSSMETVRTTVGLAPPARRAAHLRETLEIADFARLIGVDAVGMHLGFLPADPATEGFGEMVAAVREVCDHCRQLGQDFLVETGQEPPAVLREFILTVARPNLRVSFDPANLLIYGNGDPTQAMEILAPYVGCVHCKDARRQRAEGELDVRLGSGDVDFRALFTLLRQVHFAGSLIIERHRAPDRDADIAAAAVTLQGLRAEVWGGG